MEHSIIKLALCLILGSLSAICIVGCTGDGASNSPSVIGRITDAVTDITNPDPSVNQAEKQISEIQNNLNKDNTYALTQDDVAFLKTEGLLNNENEIKGWVR